MQILVEIDKKDYEYAKDYIHGRCNMLAIYNTSRILGAIADGKTLPTGHGDLIDVSELLTVTDIRADGSDYTYVSYDEIESAPTIIEADRSEEE